MKFYCDNCNTKYKISDDKVKGKILKIRCKNCQHIIVVRETGVEPTAGGDPLLAVGEAPQTAVYKAAGGMVPPAHVGADWYVAIKGKQVGPMKKDGVLNLYRNNRIHDRSHCWHEGLANWTRFEDLPDFRQQPPSAPPVPPPPAAEFTQDDPTTYQPPVAEQQAETDHFSASDTAEFVEQAAPVEDASPNKLHSEPPTTPLESASIHEPTDSHEPVVPPAMSGAPSVPGVPPAPDPFAAVQTAPHLKVGAPIGEKTRVFIAQAGLANRKAKHRAYGLTAVAVTVALIGTLWAEWNGWIEIPWLSSKITELTVAVGGDGVAKNRRRRYTGGSGDSNIECQLTGQNCPEPEKKAPVRARPKPTQDLADMDLSDAFGTGGPNKTKVGKRGEAATMDIGAIGTGGSLSGLFGTEKSASTVRTKKGVESRIATSGGGGGLDPAAASKVISQNQNSLQKCVQDEVKKGAGITGKKVLTITVNFDGSVASARFKDRMLNQGSLGQCVTRATKRWRFPTYTDTEMNSFELPLIFTD